MHRCLASIARRGYRGQLAAACYGQATRDGDVTLVMYDVTTLHFEVEHEDKLRKVGARNAASIRKSSSGFS